MSGRSAAAWAQQAVMRSRYSGGQAGGMVGRRRFLATWMMIWKSKTSSSYSE